MADGDRRTFADYKAEVLYALGLESNQDSQLDELKAERIVNDALEFVADLHAWSWLETGQQSLDIVADQDYVELPEDYGAMIGVEHVDGYSRTMIPTTWPHLLKLRQDSINDWSRSYWYVVNLGNVETGEEDAGLSLPTLNLYPTPSESVTGGLQIVYRRFLRRMTADTDRPQWPAYMDRFLSLIARGFAKLDHDDDAVSADMQQAQQMLPNLLRRDGERKPSRGVMRGGLFPRTTPISPFYPRNIPNPTPIGQ